MPIEILGFTLKPEFSIGDIVGIAALILAAYAFYMGHTRYKKSEQFRTSREIWDRINAQAGIIEKLIIESRNRNVTYSSPTDYGEVENSAESILNELILFVYLVKRGEIQESTIKRYYRTHVFDIYYKLEKLSQKYINKNLMRIDLIKNLGEQYRKSLDPRID